MRRTAKVPIWASLTVPILLSLMLGFWGLLLAAPLLAVIFAYRAMAKKRAQDAAAEAVPQQTPPGRKLPEGDCFRRKSQGDERRGLRRCSVDSHGALPRDKESSFGLQLTWRSFRSGYKCMQVQCTGGYQN